MRPLPALALAAGILALAGCTSADPGSGATSSAPSTSASESTSAPPSESPTSPAADGLNLPTALGVPELAGRVVATGPRPVLEWDAVPGAATYQLIVRDAGGATTWAWSGSTTTIAVGGGTDPAPPDTPAALITGPSTWTVVAFDDAGAALAATADIEVAP